MMASCGVRTGHPIAEYEILRRLRPRGDQSIGGFARAGPAADLLPRCGNVSRGASASSSIRRGPARDRLRGSGGSAGASPRDTRGPSASSAGGSAGFECSTSRRRARQGDRHGRAACGERAGGADGDGSCGLADDDDRPGWAFRASRGGGGAFRHYREQGGLRAGESAGRVMTPAGLNLFDSGLAVDLAAGEIRNALS